MFYLDINKIRRKHNLTLPQLAEICGISKGLLSLYANKKQAASLSTVNKVASSLGITDITELITFE